MKRLPAGRPLLSEEPSLLSLGWKVLFILFAGSLIVATAATQVSAWLQAGRPAATVQASALRHECPLPKMTEHLVITVTWVDNRVVTRCHFAQSQGAYLAERRP
jgi:hypothetical protein